MVLPVADDYFVTNLLKEPALQKNHLLLLKPKQGAVVFNEASYRLVVVDLVCYDCGNAHHPPHAALAERNFASCEALTEQAEGKID